MAAIDLRSDTVTRPSSAMREAMAAADVGDDVYGEDPTVNRLQEVVATLLGHEAALFVPSGTMANQIALKVHTKPGDEVLVGAGAHNWLFETGAAAAIAGVQHCVLPGDGRFDGDAVHAHYKPDNHHYSPTRVVSVENTHNMAGGLVWDVEQTQSVLAAARQLGIATHLDGARLWNAAIAQERQIAELAADFDTVSVCLSKGLGAPVGSLLAGRRDLIHEAHRFRKMFGGGMRQAGVLAAAGLYAIEHHRARLADDHRRAKELGAALSALDGITVEVSSVDTNIVMADLEIDAETFVERCRGRDLLFYAVGKHRARLVTHLDTSDTDISQAVQICKESLVA